MSRVDGAGGNGAGVGASDDLWPTPYSEVNTVLVRLLEETKGILGDQLCGFYLHGSLAMGDFDPDNSDIDFLVVTSAELPDRLGKALQQMHARISACESKWAVELEGSYIPKQAIRRHDPAHSSYLRIERGGNERLTLRQHDADWIIQRHILREWGVTLLGVEPRAIIDPVEPDALRRAVFGILWWWELQLVDSSQLNHSGYRVYAILTMCRMLYTLEHGSVVSKPLAARWAQNELDPRWTPLIECALRWRNGEEIDRLDEALAFIRHTIERAGGWRVD